MSRQRTVHRCQSCGATSLRWAGRCPNCGEWNTLVEEVDTPAAPRLPSAHTTPIPLDGPPDAASDPFPTGIPEMDRVLGGGLCPSSLTLLGGEPGIGKSTLLLQVLGHLARSGHRALLVSAEEAAGPVRSRATRLDAAVPGLWLVTETTIDGIRAAVAEVQPDVVVVDSIQTVWDTDVDSIPGSVTQVRGCAHALAELARSHEIAVILVGHVTKDGGLAGPRVLEHLVDTVLSFEGDRHHALRLLRAVKHRFGPTGELGLFEMTNAGLAGVADPSGLFLGDRRLGATGSVVFPAVEGRRTLLVEIQALVAPGAPGAIRRSVTGLDSGRLGPLLAVLDQRAGISLGPSDVYVSVAGGARLSDPGADLAVCLAVTSAHSGRPVPADVVAIGEVGLGGELRQVPQAPLRLREAARLGFHRVIGPPSLPAPAEAPLLRTDRVASLSEAIDALLDPPGRQRSGSSGSLRVVPSDGTGGAC